MSIDQAVDDRVLKQRHRAMWALGDYETVAADLIPGLGAALVAACAVRAGDRVLDVAAGCGNAAIPAAALRADVVACDLTPELLRAGRELATRAGVTLQWREADAESLPFEDAEFDVVMSCVGVMFAPRHDVCADELLRVCRPGGTIGLLSWTPEGFVGQMLSAMRPYAPPPPPGSRPPTSWGSEDHLRRLLGDRVDAVTMRRETVSVDLFPEPEDFRDYFKARYGPVVAAYRHLGDDADRVAALDRDLSDLARRHAGETESARMEWEYLLTTARKRA